MMYCKVCEKTNLPLLTNLTIHPWCKVCEKTNLSLLTTLTSHHDVQCVRKQICLFLQPLPFNHDVKCVRKQTCLFLQPLPLIMMYSVWENKPVSSYNPYHLPMMYSVWERNLSLLTTLTSHHDVQCVRKKICLFKRNRQAHTHYVQHVRFALWPYRCAHTTHMACKEPSLKYGCAHTHHVKPGTVQLCCLSFLFVLTKAGHFWSPCA